MEYKYEANLYMILNNYRKHSKTYFHRNEALKVNQQHIRNEALEEPTHIICQILITEKWFLCWLIKRFLIRKSL